MSRNLVLMLVACMLGMSPNAYAADPGQAKKQTLLKPSTARIASEPLNCTNAPVLACGDIADSTTVGLINGATTYGCVEFDESGGEVVYRLELDSYTEVDLRLTGMSADLDLFLLSACNPGACIQSSTGVSSERIVACLEPGTYYVVVDGFSGNSSSFQLAYDCSPCTPCSPEVNNDTCEVAPKIPVYKDSQFLQGNTCCATDDYHGDICTGFLALGLDVTYRLDLPPGCTVAVTLRDGADGKPMDLSVYLVSSCQDPRGTCVAGSDSNTLGAESFTYSSDLGGTYYLMIDSFGNQTCGDYEVEIDFLNCGLVSVESKQWSHVKQLYR